MKSILEIIREEDPEYNPVAYACEKAGVSEKKFYKAKATVEMRGWYGGAGIGGKTTDHYLSILAKVCEEIDDYEVWGDIDPDFDTMDVFKVYTANEIRHAIFRDVVKIYGCLPSSLKLEN